MSVSVLKTPTGSTELERAFPEVDPLINPAGSNVLIQLRSPKAKTQGGILLSTYSQEAERDKEQTAKIIAVGPVAFRNRDTMEPWREGAWCEVGDYVRVPRYIHDRWEIQLPDGNTAHFGLINDLTITGILKPGADPLAIVSHVPTSITHQL